MLFFFSRSQSEPVCLGCSFARAISLTHFCQYTHLTRGQSSLERSRSLFSHSAAYKSERHRDVQENIISVFLERKKKNKIADRETEGEKRKVVINFYITRFYKLKSTISQKQNLDQAALRTQCNHKFSCQKTRSGIDSSHALF